MQWRYHVMLRGVPTWKIYIYIYIIILKKIICLPFKKRNILKLKKKKKKNYLFYSQAKKKIVTEQNNRRQAQHQAHGKPNRLQREQTHGFSKKKKKKKPHPNTEQITKSEILNQ